MRFSAPCLLLAAAVLTLSGSLSDCPAQEGADAVAQRIVGDAILEEGAYEMLQTLSDRFGPRMVGTAGHRQSMDYLEDALRKLGLETRRQGFEFPGWRRGAATARVTSPFARELRVAGLGYADGEARVKGMLEYVDSPKDEETLARDLEGRVLLVRQNLSLTQEELRSFAQAGAVAALYVNRVNGGQLLARVANHHGEAPPFPMLTVTQEEGLWLQRLIERGETPEISIELEGELVQMEGVNLVATLPGELEETIVLGGHFDSWDLGQGAIDNGLGVAQVYEAARLLARHSPRNRRSIAFVWFDAEELGLWGSRHYAETMDLQDTLAMVNLDMVGRPIALNAMGFDALVAPLQRFSNSLGSWSFEKEVANKPWLGSDHHPFILKGVPAITFNAPLDHEDARYYHDFADTLDKIDREMLGRASAIVTLLIHELANDPSLQRSRLSDAEVKALFEKAGMKERMKRSGQWPFDEN